MSILDSSLDQTQVRQLLRRLGIEERNSGVYHDDWASPGGEEIDVLSPADGRRLASVTLGLEEDYDDAAYTARHAWPKWRDTPAPRRGEIVREIGNELRSAKDDLGMLVSLEAGKILAEGRGEVQEMNDIADFAVGLSRQLYGLTMHSERPAHRMYEQWHPLGLIGCITAFNFPVAVWSWNALIAAVCGDCVIWKPSEKTPLTSIAVHNIVRRVMERHGFAGVFTLVNGRGDVIGERMIADRRVPLVSATGSCHMGRRVAEVVGERLGRTLLELGGNNGLIVMPDANPQLVMRAVLFGAVGTAGQRCTTLRRLFIHRDCADEYVEYLKKMWTKIRVGHPLDPKTLCGPLIDQSAINQMEQGLADAREQGGELFFGGERVELDYEGKPLLGGLYCRPALVLANSSMAITKVEVFAPILYVMFFDDLDDAIRQQNDVPQGLSSAIFTDNLRNAERFLGHAGSDCGIANVNIGTSGAEIGGAFGGEKDTGGGRESGSDAWKAYMRRQTVTINWSEELPLAQGIEFDL
ncbi:MAG: aldehyde dehydrogenase family protein [Acidobacteria bacterium]|nr:aldehyde dehydrogenase family protein [Acidobacteriota bacterium]